MRGWLGWAVLGGSEAAVRLLCGTVLRGGWGAKRRGSCRRLAGERDGTPGTRKDRGPTWVVDRLRGGRVLGRDVSATDIDETLVGRFVSGLARRPGLARLSGRQSEVAGGIRLLAAHLWAREVAARRRPAARCEADQWLERFDDHLVHVHGLVVGTRQTYGRYAAALLAECAGTPTPAWCWLTVSRIGLSGDSEN